MANTGPITATHEGEEGQSTPVNPGGAPVTPRPVPLWVRIVPFFVSALFFLSGIFAIFAPVPLLFLNLRSGRSWGLLAVLSNCAIVFFAGGSVSLLAYAVFVAILAISLAEFLRARNSIEASAGLTMLSIFLVGC